MSLTVCRIQKIKSWGTLKGNEAHTLRERETANANPEIDNVRIIDDASGLDLVTLVKNKIGPQKIRSNAVLAIEILLSASADYFRPDAPHEAGVYDKQRLDKFVEATVKWLHSSWGERVVRAELHLDEITPHIHAYIVPLDERGKLNCRRLFGGRINLSQLQDSFAEAVAHLGISRGIKGSTAKHTKLKKYYPQIFPDHFYRILHPDYQPLLSAYYGQQPVPRNFDKNIWKDFDHDRFMNLTHSDFEIIQCQFSHINCVDKLKTVTNLYG